MVLFQPGPAQERLARQLGPLLGAEVRAHSLQGFKSLVVEVRPTSGPLLIGKLRREPARFVTERAVLQWLRERGIACPTTVELRALEVEGEAQWLLLLEHVPGPHLADQPSPEAFHQLGRYLRAVNEAPGPFPELLTMEAEPFRIWVDDSLVGLRALSFFTPAEETALNRLLAPVRDHRLEQALARLCLVHNDPQGWNVILRGQPEEIVMLDWEASLLAPAAYQVATTLTYLAHPGYPITSDQVRVRQQAFLDGYQGMVDPMTLAFQVQRMLGALSGVYARAAYQPGAYLSSQVPATTLDDYERLIRWQCEAELRRCLSRPPKPAAAGG